VLTIGCVATVNRHQLTAIDASRPADTTQYVERGKTDLPSVKQNARSAKADTVWTIEAGTYAGQQVPLELSLAIGRKGQKERFWRFANGGGVSVVVGWKSNRYPIPVAFRHDRRSQEISPDDSAAFWTILEEMNTDFGVRIFSPATLDRDDPIDVIVVDLGIMREADGLSRVHALRSPVHRTATRARCSYRQTCLGCGWTPAARPSDTRPARADEIPPLEVAAEPT